MQINYTQHARVRQQQRGLSDTDIDLILSTGTPMNDESIILLNRDADREITKLKQEIHRLERLRSVRVVMGETDTIITAYKANHKTQKQVLRKKHRHFGQGYQGKDLGLQHD